MRVLRGLLFSALLGVSVLDCGGDDGPEGGDLIIKTSAGAAGQGGSPGKGGAGKASTAGQGGAASQGGGAAAGKGGQALAGTGGQTSAGQAGQGGSAAGAGQGSAAGSTAAGGSMAAGGSVATGGAGAGPEAGAGGSGQAGSPPQGGAGAGGSGDACPRVKIDVAAGATLNVRPTPSTQQAAVGQLSDGAIVDVLGQEQGEAVSGNTLWFHIQGPGVEGYISAVYAQCTTETVPVVTPPDGFYLPLECGKSCKIAQGNFGSFSHSGKSAYAFDFSISLNTPMVAMADGTVAYLYDKTGPGDPCYNGGDSSCFPYANYVVLKHGDGSLSTYKHLNKVNVTLGQAVKRGTVLGLSGSTGYSTGPHAHVMRMEDCGQYSCQSIPLEFVDVGGDHVPDQGETVTSGNCP